MEQCKILPIAMNQFVEAYSIIQQHDLLPNPLRTIKRILSGARPLFDNYFYSGYFIFEINDNVVWGVSLVYRLSKHAEERLRTRFNVKLGGI